MRVGAAAPAGVADADLARTLSGLYDVALNAMPEQATVFGVDTGTHTALKGELHHASIAATERRRQLTADQFAALRKIDRSELSVARRHPIRRTNACS